MNIERMITKLKTYRVAGSYPKFIEYWNDLDKKTKRESYRQYKKLYKLLRKQPETTVLLNKSYIGVHPHPELIPLQDRGEKGAIKIFTKFLKDFDYLQFLYNHKYVYVEYVEIDETRSFSPDISSLEEMSNRFDKSYKLQKMYTTEQSAWMVTRKVKDWEWRKAGDNYEELHEKCKDEYYEDYLSKGTYVPREFPVSWKDYECYTRLRQLKEKK
jgi:hypothetical protein